MEVEFDRNVTQSKRFHGNVAIVEEILLARDDGLCDTKNRGESLFGIAYQPSSFLKLLAELCVTGVACPTKNFRITPVDTDSR